MCKGFFLCCVGVYLTFVNNHFAWRLVSWAVYFCPKIIKTILFVSTTLGFNAKIFDQCREYLIMETWFLCILAYWKLNHLCLLLGSLHFEVVWCPSSFMTSLLLLVDHQMFFICHIHLVFSMGSCGVIELESCLIGVLCSCS